MHLNYYVPEPTKENIDFHEGAELNTSFALATDLIGIGETALRKFLLFLMVASTYQTKISAKILDLIDEKLTENRLEAHTSRLSDGKSTY